MRSEVLQSLIAKLSKSMLGYAPGLYPSRSVHRSLEIKGNRFVWV